MAPEERRFSAAEWAEIHAEYRAQMARGVNAMHPDPKAECELGPFVPTDPSPPRRLAPASFQPATHLAEWFTTISKADVEKLECLISLSPNTVRWIADKNDRELKQLDGAVEFITSSRTAGKWLLWIGGLSVTFVGGVTALAKNGIDLFAMLRGGR